MVMTILSTVHSIWRTWCISWRKYLITDYGSGTLHLSLCQWTTVAKATVLLKVNMAPIAKTHLLCVSSLFLKQTKQGFDWQDIPGFDLFTGFVDCKNIQTYPLPSLAYFGCCVESWIPNRDVPLLNRFMWNSQSPTEVGNIPPGQNSHSHQSEQQQQQQL